MRTIYLFFNQYCILQISAVCGRASFSANILGAIPDQNVGPDYSCLFKLIYA